MEVWNGSCSDLALLSRNSTSEIWRLSSPRDDASSIVVTVLLIAYLVVGFVWNVLILASIFRDRLYKKSTYLILLNLAAADTLWCAIVGVDESASVLFGEYPYYGKSDYERCFFCKASVATAFMLTLNTGSSLALMSLDRLIYLKWPLKYTKIVTVTRVSILLATCWGSSALLCFSFMLDFGMVQVYRLSSCDIDIPGSIWYLGLLSLPFVLISLTILVSNVWILAIVFQNRREKVRRECELPKNIKIDFQNIKHVNKYDKKFYRNQMLLSKGFGAIIAVTILVWIILGSLILATLAVDDDFVDAITTSTYFVEYLLPILHPLIETCFIPRGRKFLLKALCCHRKSK